MGYEPDDSAAIENREEAYQHAKDLIADLQDNLSQVEFIDKKGKEAVERGDLTALLPPSMVSKMSEKSLVSESFIQQKRHLRIQEAIRINELRKQLAQHDEGGDISIASSTNLSNFLSSQSPKASTRGVQSAG